jgi:hypothetical protein
MFSAQRGRNFPGTLQVRLQNLVALIGSADVAHTAIRKYPQLLSFLPSTVASNWDQLKSLLGATAEEMHKIVIRSAK